MKDNVLLMEIDKPLYETIHSVQYDRNSRFVHVKLLNNSLPFDLTNKRVILSGSKPDGEEIFNTCKIVEDLVVIEITEDMNAVPGVSEYSLEIYGGDMSLLQTKNFKIKVTPSVRSNKVESRSEVKALTDALSEVQNIDNRFAETNAQLSQTKQELSSQLSANKNELAIKIQEVASTGTTTEVLQSTTQNFIQEKIADGTIANLTIEDDSLTGGKLKNNDVPLYKIKNVTVNKPINVLNPATATVGKILYNFTGTLNTIADVNGAYSDFIKVTTGEKFIVNGSLGPNSTVVMFFASKNDSSYHSRVQATDWSRPIITSPIDGYMKCNVVIQGTTINNVMIARGTVYPSSYIPFSEDDTYILNDLILPDDYIANENLKDNSVKKRNLSTDIRSILENETRKLYLTNAYVKKGSKLRIPYESIILADDIHSLKVKSTYENGYFKCFHKDFIREVTGSVGENIAIYDAKTDLKISDKDFSIIAVDPSTKTNPTTVKNILVLGDSFVQSGYISKGIKDALDSYGFTNFNFIGEKETFGVKHQGQGGYRINDFLLNPANMRPGFNHNPFWNPTTNAVDFAYYMDTLGVTGDLDYMVIHLGVNDLQNGRTKEQMVQDMLLLIDYAKVSYPNCKFIVNGLVTSYKDNRQYNAYYYNEKVFEYNKLLFDSLNGELNVTFAPIATTFNADFAYPVNMVAPYKGSTETEKVVTDYLHPSECGYYMIADVDSLVLINLF